MWILIDAMKCIIVANWKMHPATYKEAVRLFGTSQDALGKAKDVSLVVAPPSLYLRQLKEVTRNKRVAFAVQNAHYEIVGAHTGEISMKQAKDSGAAYVIIGHAERRSAGETDSDVSKKTAAALAAGIIPIVCVGERSRGVGGEYFDAVREQLRTGLRDVASKAMSRLLIAYEPVWAIGATCSMSPRDMQEMAIFIHKTIVDMIGEGGMTVKILYGGSIEAENARAMLEDGGVQGLLVGRASEHGHEIMHLLGEIGQM